MLDSKSSVPQGTVGSNPTLSASSNLKASRGLRGAFFALLFCLLRVTARYLAAADCETRLLQSDNLIGEGDGPCVVDAANYWGADLFVAIHCNAEGNTARGAETLCYGADSAAGRLARCIQQRVTAGIQATDAAFPDRGQGAAGSCGAVGDNYAGFAGGDGVYRQYGGCRAARQLPGGVRPGRRLRVDGL